MKIIDRYILSEVLKALLTIIISFVLLFLIFDFSVNAGKFSRHGIGSAEIFEYYLFRIPSLAADVMPMVLLLALFWSMNRMIKDHEMAALQASGVTAMRVGAPLFILGLVVAVLNFQVNERINTRNARRMNRFVEKLKGEASGDVLQKQHFLTDTNSSLLWFQSFDPKKSRMEGHVTWDRYGPDGNLIMRLFADSGEYISDSWWLYNLQVIFDTPTGEVKFPHTYKRRKMYEWDFRPSELGQSKDFSEFRISWLRRGMRKYRYRLPGMAQKMRIELHNRFALPLMNIVSLLLAFPFAFRVRTTRSVLAGIGISFLLVFAYHGVYTLSIIMAKNGIFVPYIMWLPNVSFSIAGIALFKRLT